MICRKSLAGRLLVHFTVWVMALPVLVGIIIGQFIRQDNKKNVQDCLLDLSSFQPEVAEYLYNPNFYLLIIAGIFFIVVLVVTVVIIRSILKPARQLKTALSGLHPGKVRRIPEHFPYEIKEIATEINTVLQGYEQWCHSIMKQVDNLAHSLKNSITIINNEAENIETEQASIICNQVDKITKQLNRFTTLSAATLRHTKPSEKIRVEKVVQDIFMLTERVYVRRKLRFFQRNLERLFFYGDALDLEEILGNLIDNACKWANNKVVVSGKYQQGLLALAVDDDGPGIPEDQMEKVTDRGYKLDERLSGQGLGLDIVQNIVQLYGGRMVLSKSGLGGLRVAVYFPLSQ